MEIKDLTMGKKLSDEELEQVAGGKWVKKSAWWHVCSKYVCQMCGSTSMKRNQHAPGCTVPAIEPPEYVPCHSDDMGAFWASGKNNGCWSCKYVWYGENYPKDEDDLWCNK